MNPTSAKSNTDRNGRREVRLGALVDHIQTLERNPVEAGFTRFLKVEHLDADRLKVERWGRITDEELPPTFYKVFKSGQVLYPTRNPHLRRTAVADFDGICGEKTLTIQSNGEVNPELLPFVFQSERFIEYATSMAIGSTNPHVRWRDISAYRLKLPESHEQERIARILVAATQAEEAARESVNAAWNLLRTLSQHHFPIAPLRYAARFQESLQQLRSELRLLGDVSNLQSGYPFKSSEFSESGVRLLRCSNVGVNSFNWDRTLTRHWPVERVEEVKDYELALGDIIIAMDRPFVTEGFKIARIGNADLPALLLQRVGRFQLSSELSPDYLWVFLHSESFKWQLLRVQQGTDLPHISRFDVEGTRLPVPAIDEQERVATEFSSAERTYHAARNHFDSLHAVRQSLINRLIDGGANDV